MTALLPALARRRAQRAFSPEPVSDEVLDTLWQAVSVAPSHGNSQSTRLLLPADDDQRRELVQALSDGNRGWASAAPVLVGLAAIPSHDRPAENRDGSLRELWGFHAGIALGNLMAQATEAGLIAHPMAGFDEASVRDVFNAPHDVRVLAVIAIGYPGDPATLPPDLRSREEASQNRMPLERLLVRGMWADIHSETARSYRRRNG